MTTKTCEACDYWYRIDDKGGRCCRYPPTASPQRVQVVSRVVVGQRPSPVSFMDVISWPKTKPGEICGEFSNEQA